ncbi:uncharacterized protein MYCFIDRAFT_180248 [Pseudocercospora fijiensis CIRAD86]|uniref:Uncharacterized protein n=1 Tax=Pseudocercospora fijiensis (strain CIRAD86) TaxID=383855 RepID=M3AIT2_PSEFD|nr:uncharacterized protein MYCFIDRAFT_180248 [Pseudocercospora fijiensis CIRAD86]EME77103.1 hypothetical protein MYCFIDRAFT_180248 [Pseudocercospora fijiensis CIRAD86]
MNAAFLLPIISGLGGKDKQVQAPSPNTPMPVYVAKTPSLAGALESLRITFINAHDSLAYAYAKCKPPGPSNNKTSAKHGHHRDARMHKQNVPRSHPNSKHDAKKPDYESCDPSCENLSQKSEQSSPINRRNGASSFAWPSTPILSLSCARDDCRTASVMPIHPSLSNPIEQCPRSEQSGALHVVSLFRTCRRRLPGKPLVSLSASVAEMDLVRGGLRCDVGTWRYILEELFMLVVTDQPPTFHVNTALWLALPSSFSKMKGISMIDDIECMEKHVAGLCAANVAAASIPSHHYPYYHGGEHILLLVQPRLESTDTTNRQQGAAFSRERSRGAAERSRQGGADDGCEGRRGIAHDAAQGKGDAEFIVHEAKVLGWDGSKQKGEASLVSKVCIAPRASTPKAQLPLIHMHYTRLNAFTAAHMQGSEGDGGFRGDAHQCLYSSHPKRTPSLILRPINTIADLNSPADDIPPMSCISRPAEPAQNAICSERKDIVSGSVRSAMTTASSLASSGKQGALNKKYEMRQCQHSSGEFARANSLLHPSTLGGDIVNAYCVDIRWTVGDGKHDQLRQRILELAYGRAARHYIDLSDTSTTSPTWAHLRCYSYQSRASTIRSQVRTPHPQIESSVGSVARVAEQGEIAEEGDELAYSDQTCAIQPCQRWRQPTTPLPKQIGMILDALGGAPTENETAYKTLYVSGAAEQTFPDLRKTFAVLSKASVFDASADSARCLETLSRAVAFVSWYWVVWRVCQSSVGAILGHAPCISLWAITIETDGGRPSAW